MQTQKIAKPISEASVSMAKVSLIATITFLILLILLHFIKSDLDPTWRMISEYAIGDYGWVMQLAFFALAISNIALCISIKSEIHTIAGKIGLIMLFISGVATMMAGVFVSDPITTNKNELTSHGNLHGIAFMISVSLGFIASILISWSLGRHNSNWFIAKKKLLWSTVFYLGCLLLMFAVLFIMVGNNQGKFGPEVLIGIPNRLFIISNCIWLIVVAKQAISLRSKELN